MRCSNTTTYNILKHPENQQINISYTTGQHKPHPASTEEILVRMS